jgi:putative autoinducer-2 (AI-2) aldolase
MDWGLRNRMARLVRPDTGRCVMLAVDHGYFLGPTSRLENPRQAIEPILPYADSLMLTRGVLRSSVEANTSTPIVLRVSGGTSIIGPSLANEGITTSLREAVRLNAVGVALSIFIGTEHERVSLLNLAKLVDEAQEYGMPVLAVTAVGKELEKRDARFLGLSCRIAAELGASLVKTYYCDGFESVVQGCPVPVVIAGGPRTENDLEVLEFVYDGLQQGAIGVNLGRNIWQNENPQGMARALQALIHEGKNPKEAFEIFQSMKN